VNTLESLSLALTGSPYQAYSYSYPHKTAYGPLKEPLPLEQVWREQARDALFLYVHIPFCEMRCGFCNLFTMAKPQDELATRYMDALQRQAEEVKRALGDASFARFAIGGGTPTQVSDADFDRIFDIAAHTMGCDLDAVPISCETSPETISDEKIAIMKARGVTRLSIGVQSFHENETKGARRPQPPHVLDSALRRIAAAGFDTFNLDLIYGLRHQTAQSWQSSLETAMGYEPEEVFLYPLYVRPLTGLGHSSTSWDDHRLALYRQGRDFLMARGYAQVSMRMFRRTDAGETPGPVYCCQRDGMVGLGAGARSYAGAWHYSSEYAVGRRGVVSIIEDFSEREARRFAQLDYGFELDADELRRRLFIISLLSHEGVSQALYESTFDEPVTLAFGAELDALTQLNMVEHDSNLGTYKLTLKGFDYSDVIGPWLYSEQVQRLSESFELA
jgi:oxygen-independent coproporphyrinogen-3 oxidase